MNACFVFLKTKLDVHKLLQTIMIQHTIAFYNTENLFDIRNDQHTNDDDFLEKSAKRWTVERFERKVYKTGLAISRIGLEESQKPPTIIGLAEVENDHVLAELIQSKELNRYNYGFIHYDSADERGIDVALLYNKDYFTVTHSEPFSVYIQNDLGVVDYTRDILLVSGFLDGEMMHFIVNHWPSRHEGSDITEFKRLLAADKVIEVINHLKQTDANAKIVVMGDFNDNPNSKSIHYLKESGSLFNPLETVWSYSRGSVNHNFGWIMFDQILLSTNFFEHSNEKFSFEKADIFDEDFLTQYSGKFRGQPYRTYAGKKYKGGFSDHFPVYILIKRQQ